MDAADIRSMLWRSGVRQWRLARVLGMHEATLSRLLRPGGEVSEELAARIATAVDELRGMKEAVEA